MKTQKKGTIDIIMPNGEIVEWSAIASGIDSGTTPEDVQQMIDESIVDKANLVNGVVPEQELPSYVDDVVEYSSRSAFPQQGDVGKIYVALDTGFIYRWTGSQYVQIAAQDNVVEADDYASLPVTGQPRIIYITKDTNKQYRWDATNEYVELSPEDEIEFITYTSGGTLTQEQLDKAKKGKLAIITDYDVICIYCGLFTASSGSIKLVHCFYGIKTVNYFISNGSVPATVEVQHRKIEVDPDTLMMNSYSTNSNRFITDVGSNFFASNVDSVANGRRIVREMNVAGKLIPSYSASDANKVVKINANGDGVVLATDETGNDIEVVEYQTTTPLTDEQIAKAQAGRLAVSYNGKLAFKTQVFNQSIYFQTDIGVYGSQDAGAFVSRYYRSYYLIQLDLNTKYFTNVSGSYETPAEDSESNVFDSTVVPNASGKRIVREMNLRKTQDMLTPNVYSASSTYDVGDYVIYQNQLYRCTTAITVAEAWTPAHWTLTNLNSEIESKQDKLVSGTNIKTINQQSILGPGNIEIDASHMTMVTYDELVALIEGNELIPGMWYRITDYTTMINGVVDLSIIGQTGYLPYATSEEVPFDIVAIAVDNHTLSENVKAMRPSSGEGIFATGQDNPETWELKYTIENDTYKFPWADSINGKGVIYYMKDGGNNEAWYDFKNIKFLMYALRRHDNTKTIGASFEYNANNNDYRYGTLLDAFYTLMGNPIGENIEIDVGEIMGSSVLSLITFIDDINRQTLYDAMDWTKILSGLTAKMGTEVDLATLASMLGTTESALEGMTEIQVLRTFFNADFYYTFNARIPDSDFPSEYVNWDMSIISNKYGYCHDNQLGHCVDVFALAAKEMGMADNIIIPAYGLNMMCFQNIEEDVNDIEPIWGNKFGSNCYANVFGEAAHENYFGEYCWGNRFGSYFHGNKLGHSCNSNSFEDTCSFNFLGNYVADNRFGVNCWENRFGNSCHLNTLEQSCRGNVFGNLNVDNHLGNHIYYCTFGEECCNINLTDDGTANDYYDYQKHNVFENGVSYIELKKATSTSDYLQNVKVCQGVYGEINDYITIEATPNLDYQVEYKKSDSTVVLL